jgi:hypothetical protein
MTNIEDLKPHKEVVAVEFNNFLDFVDNLSDEQKQQLAQKLIGQNSPLTVVLGGYNVINNSLALQLNGDTEKIAEQLQGLPPDTIKTLMEAIAMWIGQQKSPK